MKNTCKQEKVIHPLTFNPGLALTGFQPTQPGGSFLEGPEKFSRSESHRTISNLMITELFFLHIQ